MVCTSYYAATVNASPANSYHACPVNIAVISHTQPDFSTIMRRILFYDGGEIDLTHRLASSMNQFQQIHHAQERTILAYDDLRIGSNEIRPLRRNRADRDIIDPEQ